MLLFTNKRACSVTSASDCDEAESQAPSCSTTLVTKRKAETQDSEDEEVEDGGVVVSMPAHKMALMAKSEYFETRLSTALGNATRSVIREHACSLGELRAMEAVVEFMYKEKLSLDCSTIDWAEMDTAGVSFTPSQTQRLILTLTVSSCVLLCHLSYNMFIINPKTLL